MRKYMVFVVVSLPLFFTSVAATAVAVAFPAMVDYFQTSLVLAGWVLSVYQLVTVGTIPAIARFSDTVGRRATFMICLVLFVVGSALCALAPSIGWLIFFRVIEGIGGGGFTSAAIGIISDDFPYERQRLIGLFTSISTFGSVAGPAIGGLIVQYFGWQAVFWLNVPMGLLALVLSWYFLKADVRKTGPTHMDYSGVGLLTGAVAGIMITFTLMGKNYNIAPVIIVSVAMVAIAMAVLFLYHCRSDKDAIFSLKMITRRPFLAANIYNFAFGSVGENGIMSLLPLYATSVYGMSVLQGGLIITPRAMGVVVVSIIASLMIMSWGYRRPIVIGTLIMAVGTMLLALEPGATTMTGLGLSPVLLLVLTALIVGVGAGLVNPAANNACIELMPEKAASITGLRQVFRRMGQTIGIAASTLVLELSGNMALGFSVLFIGYTVMLLVSIIAAYSMPAGPKG